MRILLTNDDGYRASGINVLYQTLIDAGYEVILAAPERNSSGSSQSISVYSPISITPINDTIYFITGTPADSVRLGLQYIYKTVDNYPHMVISGINLGENVADDIFYSGTVGAAREGVLHNIPSIAFSVSSSSFHYLKDAARIVIELLQKIKNDMNILNKPFLWNVNIPNKPYHEIDGFAVTKLGRRSIHRELLQQTTIRGDEIFWQGLSGSVIDNDLDTDATVCEEQNKVSITPLEMLPTDYSQIDIIKNLLI